MQPRGATLTGLYIVEVSILIRPEGDATSNSTPAPNVPLAVSILIRPEGRMQQRDETGDMTIALFQSSSGPEGRMQRLYLNFLSVLREPPDTGFPFVSIALIISFLQLRFSYEREPPGCNGPGMGSRQTTSGPLEVDHIASSVLLHQFVSASWELVEPDAVLILVHRSPAGAVSCCGRFCR